MLMYDVGRWWSCMILNDDAADNDAHSDSDDDDDHDDVDNDESWMMMIMMMIMIMMMMMILNDHDDNNDDYDDISMQRSGGPIHRAAADQHIPVLQRDDDIETEWRSKSDEEPIRRVEDQGDAH